MYPIMVEQFENVQTLLMTFFRLGIAHKSRDYERLFLLYLCKVFKNQKKKSLEMTNKELSSSFLENVDENESVLNEKVRNARQLRK